MPDATPKPLPPTDINKIEFETSDYLKQQLSSTLRKLQEQKADICGFGRIYFQHHPDEEQQLKEQWGQMFQHAKIDVQVKAVIVSKGMLI
ncbi:Ger(x)C family spore germination C-terminal domain-containing protein [Alicyclobacillus fastidiosus]|uniref:Ger(x)C family spore germination C-terminal domain-containing protein n=1 Tax=Alicyclobacillus fastidiosus TaxID=392011 RepID=UPI0034D557A6